MLFQLVIFAAFMGTQYMMLPQSNQSKAVSLYQAGGGAIALQQPQSDSILFNAANTLLELQKVKLDYMSDGLNAVKSLSESTSLTDIIWNKFGDVMTLIKSFLLVYIMKYFLM